jgi:hypothetical protein
MMRKYFSKQLLQVEKRQKIIRMIKMKYWIKKGKNCLNLMKTMNRAQLKTFKKENKLYRSCKACSS